MSRPERPGKSRTAERFGAALEDEIPLRAVGPAPADLREDRTRRLRKCSTPQPRSPRTVTRAASERGVNRILAGAAGQAAANRSGKRLAVYYVAQTVVAPPTFPLVASGRKPFTSRNPAASRAWSGDGGLHRVPDPDLRSGRSRDQNNTSRRFGRSGPVARVEGRSRGRETRLKMGPDAQ